MNLALLLLLLALGMSFLGVATLPRWCFMTINRSQIWRLRDELDADMRAGRLPCHPAADELRNEFTQFLAVLPMLTPFAIRRMLGRLERRDLARVRQRRASQEGLTEDQRDALDRYHENLLRLVTRSMILNSWAGVAMLATAATYSWVRRSGEVLLVHLVRRWEVPVESDSRLAEEIRAAEELVHRDDAERVFGLQPLAA